MVSEALLMRRFVSRQLQRCSDLSTLTLGILRKKYLEHVGRDSLNAQQRQLLKKIVEEELLKMQDNSSDDEPLIKVALPKNHNKRKREDEDDGDDDEEDTRNKDEVSRKKKSRFKADPPDSPDSGIEKIANEEQLKDTDDIGSDKDLEEVSSESADEKENEGNKKRKVLDSDDDDDHSSSDEDKENQHTKARGGKTKQSMSSDSKEEVSDEEMKDEDKENQKRAKGKGTRKKQSMNSDSLEDVSGDELKSKNEGKVVGKGSKTATQKKGKRKEDKKVPKVMESEAVRKVQKEVFGSSSESEDETRSDDDDDDESDKDTDKKKAVDKASSEEDVTESVKTNKGRQEAEDSDSSSSLPSLEEDEEAAGTKSKQEEERKKRSSSKKKGSEMSDSKAKGAKDDENKAVSRLKRYIALCGVRRNYKKLFEGCRSVKAKVAVLKKELEELGVEGQPSIEKCKKARMKREEAQELAELDVSNIITTQGRPKRRAAVPWQKVQRSSPPASAYKRVVCSDSDSEGGSKDRGCKRTTDWSNLQGIISDDADSN